jgi:hypothetical protein
LIRHVGDKIPNTAEVRDLVRVDFHEELVLNLKDYGNEVKRIEPELF